jgi:hypothetical protein
VTVEWRLLAILSPGEHVATNFAEAVLLSLVAGAGAVVLNNSAGGEGAHRWLVPCYDGSPWRSGIVDSAYLRAVGIRTARRSPAEDGLPHALVKRSLLPVHLLLEAGRGRLTDDSTKQPDLRVARADGTAVLTCSWLTCYPWWKQLEADEWYEVLLWANDCSCAHSRGIVCKHLLWYRCYWRNAYPLWELLWRDNELDAYLRVPDRTAGRIAAELLNLHPLRTEAREAEEGLQRCQTSGPSPMPRSWPRLRTVATQAHQAARSQLTSACATCAMPWRLVRRAQLRGHQWRSHQRRSQRCRAPSR